MNRSTHFVLFIALTVVAAVAAGCSDNPVTDDNPADAGVVSGEVNVASGDFEITVPAAAAPQGPAPGPFVIMGRNIRYDNATGTLVADLSVVNRSIHPYPEPVRLVFVSLMPEGSVEVLNPDNDVHGPGAAIVFEFENDDAMWTPGEESLPRPVEFAAGRGRAVAFTARIEIGSAPGAGVIAGTVWDDADADGMRDPDESGIAGAAVTMTRDAFDILYRSRTDSDGRYRFENLPAGFYTVYRGRSACRPTTPTEVHVVLADSGAARVNFGCQVASPDSGFVEVGDWVQAEGEYRGTPMGPYPPSLLARILRVNPCECKEPPCPGLPCENVQVLAGPVTDINRDRRALQVMGSWLRIPPDDWFISMEIRLMLDLDDIEVGDRVRAAVMFPPDIEGPAVVSLSRWIEDSDHARGYVRRVYTRPDGYGPPQAVWVLDTRIDLTRLTGDSTRTR